MSLPLEKQVVSLELSKKLCKLGVKQESIFYWEVPWEEDEETRIVFTTNNVEPRWSKFKADYYAAFTVAELGEDGPEQGFEAYKRPYREMPGMVIEEGWYVRDRNTAYLSEGLTLADALAYRKIYLIENGLITL